MKEKTNIESFQKGYDKVLEHRTRFAVCALLTQEKKIPFARFKAILNESDGNLGAQLRRLEDAGYVTVEKTFQDRKPLSLYSITAKGRKRLRIHLEAVEGLVKGL